jgi:DNA-binding XRE family transcriptional regulator
MILGKKLQEIRKKLKLRQYEVAEIVGISQKNICAIESREDIYISTLKKYISSLGGEIKVYVEFKKDEVIYDISNHIK